MTHTESCRENDEPDAWISRLCLGFRAAVIFLEGFNVFVPYPRNHRGILRLRGRIRYFEVVRECEVNLGLTRPKRGENVIPYLVILVAHIIQMPTFRGMTSNNIYCNRRLPVITVTFGVDYAVLRSKKNPTRRFCACDLRIGVAVIGTPIVDETAWGMDRF